MRMIAAVGTAGRFRRLPTLHEPTGTGRRRAGLLLVVSLIVAACDIVAGDADGPAEDAVTADPAMLPGDPPPPVDNRFDAGQLSPGDEVLGVRVTRLTVQPARPPDSGYFGEVTFSGEITVSGRYRAHPEYPAEDANYMCFFVDGESASRLPRFEADERLPWLCFTNTEMALAELGPLDTEGGATVVIDDYRTVRRLTNAFDTARLVRVISRNVLDEE
ncbi:MAG TPA: hypothetical protein VNZ57_06115 [Longimicrobiales bacterium]|nr:hypothetical protein [Longimicrobiales bacterium]